MSYLLHIVSEARSKGRHTEDWEFLKNVHFKGDDAIQRVKEWAASESLMASFDYSEQSFTHVKVRDVTFFPIRPAK